MKISNLILLCTILVWSLFNSISYACDLCGSTKPRPPRDSYTSYIMCAHPPSTVCDDLCPPKPRMMCEACPQTKQQPIVAAVKPVANATANEYEDPNMEGFYLGLNGGYGFGDVKSSIGRSVIIGSAAAAGGHLSVRGTTYGLYTGYQKQFRGTGIVGVELGGGRNGIKGSFTAYPLTASIKESTSYNAAIRAGVIMNYWLVSIKLGIEESKLKYTVTDTTDALGNLTVNNKKSVRGNLFGIGFETMVSDSMMFGGEWTLTSYDKSSGTAANGAVYSFKPKLSFFKIRLGYLF